MKQTRVYPYDMAFAAISMADRWYIATIKHNMFHVDIFITLHKNMTTPPLSEWVTRENARVQMYVLFVCWSSTNTTTLSSSARKGQRSFHCSSSREGMTLFFYLVIKVSLKNVLQLLLVPVAFFICIGVRLVKWRVWSEWRVSLANLYARTSHFLLFPYK